MQIFTFNCNSQRMRRYTSGVIYAGSYDKTIFKFNFNTPDWDFASAKTAVFSCCGDNYEESLDENNMCKVPEEVLYEGYFLVSVYGGDLITNMVRVPVAKKPGDIFPDEEDKWGVVFVPDISDDGILSWTNNGGLDNPNPIDLTPFDEDNGEDYVWEDDV